MINQYSSVFKKLMFMHMGPETVMANPQINFCAAPFQTKKVSCFLYNDTAVWTNLMFNWPTTQCQMNQFKQHMN